MTKIEATSLGCLASISTSCQLKELPAGLGAVAAAHLGVRAAVAAGRLVSRSRIDRFALSQQL